MGTSAQVTEDLSFTCMLNRASDVIMVQSWRSLNVGSDGSYSYSYLPCFCLFKARLFIESYQMFSTVILFYVSVPVLSEQIQLVDPKVSTASKFFTSTYLSASLLAVIAKEIVMHPNKPSGTLATIIPIP